ncbi:WD40/YVTN/BNR-like repeat-containing protein [Haloarchaeobius sp. DFWS5]|uniref:WD40/YVTN/BNR-like repeat-containing protein n=1 Tax=Haloarchaeobius sp. DFWS5 TaxID=3446114 RepID=UPI003EBEB31F
MTLVIGTHDGVYRVTDGFDTVERTLDATVHRVRRFDAGLFAAADTGLYRSPDGVEWAKVESFAGEVVSTAVSPTGSHWYVGTKPAALYVSEDEGVTWNEVESFQGLPSRERWRDRAPGDDAGVRTIAIHQGAPDRLVVGVEPGGVHSSVDRGRTWNERCDGVHDDVHHVLAQGVDEYVASTGGGLYRTTDAGRTWLRQDTDFRDFWFTYFREAFHHDGTLYVAANGWGPAQPGGALLEWPDDEDVPNRVPYPGEKDSFVVSWAVDDGELYAGTMDVTDGFGQHEEARVLKRIDTGWMEVGRVPASARSMVSY